MQDDFDESVSSINWLLWYSLSDGTDLWQPVDADHATCLKSPIAVEHRKLMNMENNAKR